MEENARERSLEPRIQKFERWLLVDRGLAESTVKMAKTIVQRFLEGWGTLRPAKDQIKQAKEQRDMDGYNREYVGNISTSFKDYGEFLGEDLEVKPPPRGKRKPPRDLRSKRSRRSSSESPRSETERSSICAPIRECELGSWWRSEERSSPSMTGHSSSGRGRETSRLRSPSRRSLSMPSATT